MATPIPSKSSSLHSETTYPLFGPKFSFHLIPEETCQDFQTNFPDTVIHSSHLWEKTSMVLLRYFHRKYLHLDDSFTHRNHWNNTSTYHNPFSFFILLGTFHYHRSYGGVFDDMDDMNICDFTQGMSPTLVANH